MKVLITSLKAIAAALEQMEKEMQKNPPKSQKEAEGISALMAHAYNLYEPAGNLLKEFEQAQASMQLQSEATKLSTALRKNPNMYFHS